MRKRILLLNTSFKYEGPNDVLWQLARHVNSSRYNIVFGCMHDGGEMEKVYNDAGYQTHNFKMERFWDLRSVFRVKNFIKAEKIDLVMAQLLRSEVFGGCGTWLAGVPLVLVIQNIDSYRSKPWFFPHYYLSRLSMLWPVKVVTASEYVRQYVMKYQGVKEDQVIAIHDTVDPEQFIKLKKDKKLVREELKLKPSDIVVGTVARLTPQKGLFYLLEAFKSLSLRHKNIKLVIVGDGPQKNEILQWIRKENLEEKVLLTGFCRDYDRIMQGFDLFVLPSLWEGLPLVLLSAMASGKPVVSTRVSGIPEVITDGLNGFLVPPADTKALIEKIETLLIDNDIRDKLGERAKENIINNFSAKIMAEKYEQLWSKYLKIDKRL